MKISIIGSGWLAQPLAQQLQHDGNQVTLTTTQVDKVAQLKQQQLNAKQYVLGDQLACPDELFEADVLIIAITSKEVESYAILIDQLSAYPSLNVVYISSTSVYQNNNQSHDETSTALNHDNPIWKIEQLIQDHPSASIIRFAGLVGPGRHPGNFFSGDKVIKNPQAPVNLIHLDDCIGIITTVIEQQAWNQIFNGVADTHPTKADFYQQAAAQSDRPRPVMDNTHSTPVKTIISCKLTVVLNYVLKHPDVMQFNY